MMIDADGMKRYNVKAKIEGRKGSKVRTLNFYEAHAVEVENIKAGIKRLTKRGDTVTINVI